MMLQATNRDPPPPPPHPPPHPPPTAGISMMAVISSGAFSPMGMSCHGWLALLGRLVLSRLLVEGMRARLVAEGAR
jgi:hypothetical protein